MFEPAYISLKDQLTVPLAKYKILGFSELMELSKYRGNKASFSKLVSRLEKNEVLKTFWFDSFRRKFIHLHESTHFNFINRFHDAAVGITAFKISKMSMVTETRVNLVNFESAGQFFSDQIDEDGSFVVFRNKALYTLAFEIELTRKSAERILKKFDRYQHCSTYSLCFYFFECLHLLNTYLALYKNFCTKNNIGEDDAIIQFVHLPRIFSNSFSIGEVQCFDLNSVRNFKDTLS